MRRREFLVCALILCVCLSWRWASASNWAQASGDIQQNTVIPYYPGPSRPHWGPRYGMASIVMPQLNLSSFTATFILGGDTYSSDFSNHPISPGTVDARWESGYKNDVWKMVGTDWYVQGDIRLRTEYHRKVPRIESHLKWTLVQSGLHPPPGTTYDAWISCAPYFANNRPSTCDDTVELMWSPRRHHSGVFFNNKLWIFGGRAREFQDLPEDRSVGGILSPRIKDIPATDLNSEQLFTTQREASVLKSDVWNSDDGYTWSLVTPGCKNPQKDLVASGNLRDGQFGTAASRCSTDSDCYGAEICDQSLLTCVCPMWTPREQHAVAAYSGALFVVGGYASQLYSQFSNCGPFACGDTDASDYRYSLADVWRSTDGEAWELLTVRAFTDISGNVLGRGGHQMVVVPAYSASIVSSRLRERRRLKYLEEERNLRGSDPSASHQDWPSGDFSDQLFVSQIQAEMQKADSLDGLDSQSRSLYTASLNEAQLWVLGGRGGDNSARAADDKVDVYFNDVWVASLTDSNPVVWTNIEDNAPWSARTGHAVAVEVPSADNKNTMMLYVYGGYNNGTFLNDVWSLRLGAEGMTADQVSAEIWREDYTAAALFSTGSGQEFHYANNSPSASYINPDSDLSLLQRFWVPVKFKDPKGQRMEKRTYLSDDDIATLNSVGLYTVRDLATANQYTVLKLRGFDFPQVAAEDRLHLDKVCDYRALAIAVVDKCSLTLPSLYDGEKQMPWNVIPVFGGPAPVSGGASWHGRKNYNFLKAGVTDPVVRTELWDGCEYDPLIQGLFGPNINGIGYVDQVMSVRSPHYELENLICRQNPGPRAYFSMVSFEGRLYAMGGKQSESKFYADTWYRDAKLPMAKITLFPQQHSSDDTFTLNSDKAGSHFEYRVWDPYNYKEIRGWTAFTKNAGVYWMNWRKGGPGSGLYRIYFRAIDPAGNVDERFIPGQNVYEWYYVSPTPWDIIFSLIGAFVGLCILGYFEYRRRVKKAAMERYAMKRMRRKFKAMQRDIDGKAVDWRTLYMESKETEEAQSKTQKKKLKKTKDKNAEKREKEKQKRDKEKELIKKKLKAAKDLKEKKKGNKVEAAPEDIESQAVDAKVVSKKTTAASKSNKVASGSEFDDLFDEAQGGAVQSRKAVNDKPRGNTKQVAPAEIAAGELESSKNTELGFKQRKVNKRLKSYEEKEGDDENGRSKED